MIPVSVCRRPWSRHPWKSTSDSRAHPDQDLRHHPAGGCAGGGRCGRRCGRVRVLSFESAPCDAGRGRNHRARAAAIRDRGRIVCRRAGRRGALCAGHGAAGPSAISWRGAAGILRPVRATVHQSGAGPSGDRFVTIRGPLSGCGGTAAGRVSSGCSRRDRRDVRLEPHPGAHALPDRVVGWSHPGNVAAGIEQVQAVGSRCIRAAWKRRPASRTCN